MTRKVFLKKSWSIFNSNISLAAHGKNFPTVRTPVNERKFLSKAIDDAIIGFRKNVAIRDFHGCLKIVSM